MQLSRPASFEINDEIEFAIIRQIQGHLTRCETYTNKQNVIILTCIKGQEKFEKITGLFEVFVGDQAAKLYPIPNTISQK
jgi:hypothetical protein